MCCSRMFSQPLNGKQRTCTCTWRNRKKVPHPPRRSSCQTDYEPSHQAMCRRSETHSLHLYRRTQQTLRKGMGRHQQRLPTFNTAKSTLYRARRNQTPSLLKTIADIRQQGKWTETELGDIFHFLDDTFQNNRTIAFATTENLQDLAASETFFCNRTFYTSPSLFYQIYTIHILTDDVMTPVVYALLPGKGQAIYTRFFTLLRDCINDLGLRFSPTNAPANFETAVHNSIIEVFPGITTKRCFFHYTQVICRKVQRTGLQIPYRDVANVKTLDRRTAVLPLVPLDSMEDVWFRALEDRDEADLTAMT